LFFSFFSNKRFSKPFFFFGSSTFEPMVFSSSFFIGALVTVSFFGVLPSSSFTGVDSGPIYSLLLF
jgi:hypothetical protein